MSYLGTSLLWPVVPSGQLVSDEANIRQSLIALFSTDYGTCVFDPSYGTILKSLIFEPNTAVLAVLIADALKSAISTYEQRVSVVSIDVAAVDLETCNIVCILQIKSLNELFSFVYPFYRQLN